MADPNQTTDAQRQLQHKRWLLVDALTYAVGVATRLQEATEGTSDTLLFDAARIAICQLRDDHPAMKALTSAAVSQLKWPSGFGYERNHRTDHLPMDGKQR